MKFLEVLSLIGFIAFIYWIRPPRRIKTPVKVALESEENFVVIKKNDLSNIG